VDGETESVSDNGAGTAKAFAWKKRIGDSYQLATEALRAGRPQEAFEILFSDIERERTGRRRFLRKLQLLELCLTTGKESIARPILEDVVALIELHKIDDWEDRETVSQALITVMKASARLQADEVARHNMFIRLCRLDPAAALDYQGEG
jgi:type VI secretion system protein ImpA